MTQRARRWLTSAALSLAWLLLTAAAHAGTSILIWPLDPIIEAGDRSAAIWLENVGSDAVTVQVRILAWNQQDYQDDYASQQGIIGTPPFSTIPVGKKQLIRLTMTQPAAAGQEQAFRILIDEIPAARAEAAAPSPSSAGLRFQMRYSLPLFVYGAGLSSKAASRGTKQRAQPQLSWNISKIDGRPYLQVHNAGSGHARLSQVRLLAAMMADGAKGAPQMEIAPGLLGYVLAGQTMRWPLDFEPPARDYKLQVQLASNAEAVTLARE